MAHPDQHSQGVGLPHQICHHELVRLTYYFAVFALLLTSFDFREFVSGLIGFFYAETWRSRIESLVKLSNATSR